MLKNRKNNKISCLSCFFSHLCLPATLPADEAQAVNDLILNIKEIKKSEHVFFTHDPMLAIYSVYRGSCKQYTLDETGRERIENFYLPGDIIGLESVSLNKHRYSLMALEDTQLCVMPVEELLQQMQRSPLFTRRVLNICSYKMQNDKQIANTTNTVQRIADLLLNIFYRLDERHLNKDPIIMPMSQLDISNFLGMAHETVNRVLKKLDTENIIKIHNKKIYIKNIEQLKTLGTCTDFAGQNHS